MPVDRPTGGPPLNCLQLVDVFLQIRVPDRASELQRRPHQGFVRLLLDMMVTHGAPPSGSASRTRESCCFCWWCANPNESRRRSLTPKYLVSFGRLEGMAMEAVLTLKRVPLPDEVEGGWHLSG